MPQLAHGPEITGNPLGISGLCEAPSGRLPAVLQELGAAGTGPRNENSLISSDSRRSPVFLKTVPSLWNKIKKRS